MNPAISEMTVTYLSDAANSAVPQGYKQTDVGIIPDDWLCTDIGALNPFVTSGSRGWAEFYSEYGQPFVRITNTKRHSIYLDLSDLKFVKLPETSSEGKRTSLLNGDVLISITADIGISSYVDDSLVKPAYINQHIALVRFDLDEINSKFVTYFLSSENVQKLFRSTSDQGAKAGLNLDSVRKIKIALPSQSEQTAIANAISDVDALIQELEKLIAKKQAIKIATMQQLLNGRTRLSQFAHHPDGRKKGYKPSELGEIPEDWGVEKFNNLTTLITCGIAATPTYVSESEGYPFLSSTNVKNGKVIWKNYKHISKSLHTQLYKNNPPKVGDVLYSRVGTIGEAAVIEDEFEFSVYVSLTLIKPKSELLDSYFLMQLLNSEPYKARAKEQVYLGGGVGNLNVEVVRNYPIIVPQSNEQKAIAKILSDMDLEINSLDQRLDKTRQIKQGMMQELLSGKTRLI